MDPAERLADYLAGELDADERTAVEADLARDAVLRAQLDAMRRADGVLGHLDPATPPGGYEARLRDAVDAALASELSAEQPDTPPDELAARRERRTSRWVPAMAGVAAGIAVLAGVAMVVRGGVFDDLETADEPEAVMDMEEAEQDAPAAEEEAPVSDGPTVVVSDREVDGDDLDALLASRELAEVAGRGLDAAAGASVSSRWWGALGGGVDVGDDAVLGDLEPEADTDAPPPDAQVFGERTLGPTDRDAIGRCLDELADDTATAPIPAYVELVVFEDEPALAFGFVTLEPDTDRYERTEVWVLARADCHVLRVGQD